MSDKVYTVQDYKSGQPRWCPGCGDHAFLNSLHKAMAELGTAPHDIAVISGIGCSSRLPYYVNTYGFHTIHGRAAAIATGAKVANPNLTIWQISGDGDAAANHKGASVVEVLQNCVIFNDGTHASVATKEGRAKNAIYLEHGKPMLFGENKEFGLMQEGFGLKVVKLGENGITEKDILIHDAHCQDNTLQLKLALMEGPDFPIALGVIRDVDAPTYNDAVVEQIEEIKGKKKYHNFQELLMTNETWEVK